MSGDDIVRYISGGRPSDEQVRMLFQCPDCNAELIRQQIVPGFEEVLVAHDSTCPVLKGVTSDWS